MYKKIVSIYNYLNKRMIKYTLFTIIVSFLFDISDKPYWNKSIQKIFSYEVANVLAISLVIWGFITTLFLLYLEKINERIFGIKLIDCLKLNKSYKKAAKKIVFFLFEIILLFVVVIMEWKIIMVTLTFYMFISAIYVLTLIYVKTSKKTVLKIVNDEIKKILDELKSSSNIDHIIETNGRLLIQMIKSINYNSLEHTNILAAIHRMVDYNYKKMNINNKGLINYMVRLMLNSNENDRTLMLFFQKCFSRSTMSFEYKCEVLASWLNEEERDCLLVCDGLIKTVPESYSNKIKYYIFCEEYCRYLSGKIGQEYRLALAKYFSNSINTSSDDENIGFRYDLIDYFESR